MTPVGVWADVPDNSVTSAKVVDESLTGADIDDGSLTRDDIEPIAQHIVVATSGGDYTTVSAALAAITPSTNNRYVIDVMPGTYTENITMKSYVHLRGAGRDVAILQDASEGAGNVITIEELTYVTVSGLAIVGGNDGIYIRDDNSHITIKGNRITAATYSAVEVGGSEWVTIDDNIIVAISRSTPKPVNTL
jgi:pectin methylesterase-like acyl-CoA thioesterase